MRIEHIGATTRRSLRTKKASGQVAHRYTPLGKKRVIERRRGRVVKRDVWDDYQCSLIRQIKQRKDDGETIESIARDFFNRKLKKADGRPWVTRPKRKKKLNMGPVRRAYEYYTDLLARGLDLGHDDA